VYAGAPSNTGNYHEIPIDGLTVFLRKDAVVAEEGLRIRLRNWGIYKRLIVEGLLA
jgi:hypothetical protein